MPTSLGSHRDGSASQRPGFASLSAQLEFSLPFNTARFAGQHICPFFQDALQRLLDVCYICYVRAPFALDIRFLFLRASQMEPIFASSLLKLVRMGGYAKTPI